VCNSAAPGEPEERHPHVVDRASLIARGWAQGSIIGGDLMSKWCRVNAEIHGAVVVSQSCDLVHESLDTEPSFEIAPFSKLMRSPQSTFERGAHPRVLEFALAGVTYHFESRDRLFVPRADITAEGVRPDGKLPDDELDLLLDWVTGRYVRPAFPEELGRRLDDKKVQKAIDGQRRHVRSCFISVEPLEELGPSEDYDVRLLIVARAASRGDKQGERAIRDLVRRLVSRFAAAKGVTLAGIRDWPSGDVAPTKAQLDAASSVILRYDDEFVLAELDFWVQLNPDAISYVEPAG
jgi:hypothetical protein